MDANLTTFPTLVESPFIIAEIGGYSFGSYSGNRNIEQGSWTDVSFPNFIDKMSIQKVNGTVNVYTLTLKYQVGTNEDPNLMDRIISKATNDRTIWLKYGDWSYPTQIYKEEKAIITNVVTQLDMSGSVITYTIKCTSDAIGLASIKHNFQQRTAKGSDIIKEMLTNARYGLQEVFTGMRNIADVLSFGLISSTDAVLTFLAQPNTTALQYMQYVVDSMVNVNELGNRRLPTTKYVMSIHDDVTNKYGGTYFKITEIDSTMKNTDSVDTYTLNINYPDNTFITNFSLMNDQSWAILYEYSESSKQEQYTYNINDRGELETTYAPSVIRSPNTNDISPTLMEWWTKMTKFPIQANVTIKGLMRPSILMSYVRVNVWFAGGKKHLSSGLYIITKQVDNISNSGYTTTLNLLRIDGDTDVK